jgi:hypothetical protein
MHSEYKYKHILNRQDKMEMRIMVLNNTPLSHIAKRYGLTKRFIRYQHIHYLERDTIPVYFNSKDTAYYDDEMSYGKLNLNYNK